MESHSTVLNGFVSEYRKAVQALNLFGAEHCEPDSYAKLDYEGKVLVLSPDTLRESCWNRAEFVGVLKEEHLPDWAMDKLEQMRSQEAEPLQLSL